MRSANRWGKRIWDGQIRFIVFAIVILVNTALAQTTAPSGASSNASSTQQPAQPGTPSAQVPGSNQSPTSQPAQPAQNPATSEPPASQPAQDQTQPPEPQAGQEAPQEPSSRDQSGMFVFKREVEEVVLHATVYDEQRHIVPYLDRSAFTVFESGVPQTITSFRREDVPVAIGVVVDNSGSMRDKREQISKAVVNLVHVSNPQDEIFVVNFNENPYLDQDFTSDVNLLQTALHRVSTRGSTALYDAVVASAKHLSQYARLDKKVLLVITDGEDNMSRETLQEASRQLQQANGPVLYAVGLLGNGLGARGRAALQSLADDTGGVAYFPETMDQVDSITRTIAHDIRSQYMIAYRPHNQNGKPSYQSLRVEAHAAGYGKLTVRTRTGYYPPKTNP